MIPKSAPALEKKPLPAEFKFGCFWSGEEVAEFAARFLPETLNQCGLDSLEDPKAGEVHHSPTGAKDTNILGVAENHSGVHRIGS